MKTSLKRVLALMAAVICIGMFLSPVASFAAETTEVVEEVNAETSGKAMASGIMMAAAAGLGALAMGIVIAKSVESIAKQPEAEGKIRTAMMLGLVFVETAIIYALIVAILIIFVL